MSIAIIVSILEDPDYVYKTSDNNKDFYYEKVIGSSNFRVVISYYKKHVKRVVTAYQIKDIDGIDTKHSICIYNKHICKSDEQIQQELEDDIDYFWDLFKES